MTTRDIRPSTAITPCDVCGRTLLRGERAEAYLDGGERRWVCELCTSRALNEGWVREGTLPDYGAAGAGSQRRRSLLSRLRGRRPASGNGLFESDGDGDGLADGFGSEPDGDGAEAVGGDEHEPLRFVRRRERPARPPRPARAPRPGRAAREPRDAAGSREPREPRGSRELREPREPREPRGLRRARDGRESREPAPEREPRHVRAVPTSLEHRVAAALEQFNRSEHPRTVAGVARSLGLPAVSALPSPEHPSLVTVVTAWELCWYRYEVDLSDATSSVQQVGQGYELTELADRERLANARADEDGRLTLPGGPR